MNKKCTSCGKEKSLDKFILNKNTSSGYGSKCKDCFNVYQKKI